MAGYKSIIRSNPQLHALDEKRANSRKLMRELARRNKKYSRYVHATYHD